MNIIQIAHNPIYGDARVRKYIRTLGNKGEGHKVYVIGVDNKMIRIPNESLDEGEEKHKVLSLDKLRFKLSGKLREIFGNFIKITFYLTGFLFLIFYIEPPNLINFFKNNTNYFLYASIALNIFFFLMIFLSKGQKLLKKVRKKIRLNRLLMRIGFLLAKPFTRLISIYSFYKILTDELKTYEKKNIDVIHVHDHVALFSALLQKHLFPRAKIIWDAHELYVDKNTTGFYVSTIVDLFLRFYGHRIDHVITINDSFKLIYKKKYFKNQPVDVVMNATDFNEAIDINHKSDLIPKSIKSNKKVLLFQGGLAKNRGIEQLLLAAKHISDDWNIVFMGRGELEPLIIETKKILKNIFLIPPVDQKDLFNWTSSADLGIIPYRNVNKNHLYCTPNKLWEFTNAGVPFIATDLIEIGSFLRKNNVGFLLNREFSVEDIYKIINEISFEDLQNKRHECIKQSKNLGWNMYKKVILDAYRIE